MALSTIPTAGLSSDQGVNFRNLIINGDMSIAQRGTSTSGCTTAGYYACDRWDININGMGTHTISQDTDVPTGQGFAKSFKWLVTTADASPASTDNIIIQHHFEGQMLQQLKKGTSNAESVTMSFWVKSNKTGTYTVQLRDTDNSRHICKEFTINSSATWEKKTLTFAGDNTGAFDNDNNKSLQLDIYLGAGSNFTSGTLASSWASYTQANTCPSNVNLADNTSNYINITGVQLEVGTSATPFEFLPYDVNLQRCQRYFQLLQGFEGSMRGTTNFGCTLAFKTEMRNQPSVTQSGALQITDGNADFTQSSTGVSIPAGRVTKLGVQLNFTNFSGLTQFRPAGQNTNVNDSKVLADAEL